MEKEIDIPLVENLEKVLVDRVGRSPHWAWRIKGTNIEHHPTQPAIKFKNGYWVWYWMGKRHRWDGPAVFWNGKYLYFIHGEPLNRDQWERHLQRLEWLRNKAGEI